MRGAAAVVVVVVVVAAMGCGPDAWARPREKGPAEGFSTLIRWVSSVPSRFQGGDCHESSVEGMFPVAQAVEFREAESPSPEDSFVCVRRPVAFRLRCTMDRGGRQDTPQSPQ